MEAHRLADQPQAPHRQVLPHLRHRLEGRQQEVHREERRRVEHRQEALHRQRRQEALDLQEPRVLVEPQQAERRPEVSHLDQPVAPERVLEVRLEQLQAELLDKRREQLEQLEARHSEPRQQDKPANTLELQDLEHRREEHLAKPQDRLAKPDRHLDSEGLGLEVKPRQEQLADLELSELREPAYPESVNLALAEPDLLAKRAHELKDQLHLMRSKAVLLVTNSQVKALAFPADSQDKEPPKANSQEELG